MKDHTPAVEAFFRHYQSLMNDALKSPPVVDAAGLRRAFANYFVGSDPKHVRGGRNGLLFRLMVPRGYAFYRRIGTERMEVRGLKVEGLDDHHAMARVHWWSSYRKKSGEHVEIEFDNIYMLKIESVGAPKIFAYVTGDERKVLADHGLI